MTRQEKNGQREIVNEKMFRNWFGEDSNNPERLEDLLLDVVNNIYSIKDLVSDIKNYE